MRVDAIMAIGNVRWAVSRCLVVVLLWLPTWASAQFFPEEVASPSSPSHATVAGQGKDLEVQFDKHKLMVRAREIQYHKKVGELRVLLELHDQSREGRGMVIWSARQRPVHLYDSYLTSQTFIGAEGNGTKISYSPFRIFTLFIDSPLFYRVPVFDDIRSRFFSWLGHQRKRFGAPLQRSWLDTP